MGGGVRWEPGGPAGFTLRHPLPSELRPSRHRFWCQKAASCSVVFRQRWWHCSVWSQHVRYLPERARHQQMHGQGGTCSTSGRNSSEAPGPLGSGLGFATDLSVTGRVSLCLCLCPGRRGLSTENSWSPAPPSCRESGQGWADVWWKGGRAPVRRATTPRL